MKNRNLILSVLFWLIASTVMAVVLPVTPFSGSSYGSDLDGTDFQIGSGVSYTNVSLRVSNNNEDGIDCAKKIAGGANTDCSSCCQEVMESKYGPKWFMDNEPEFGDCFTTCQGWSLGDEETPLGTPLCLLPFIAIYAVIRKRKEAVMA